jgi:hypothetical protein
MVKLCKIPECLEESRAKELCMKHYHKIYNKERILPRDRYYASNNSAVPENSELLLADFDDIPDIGELLRIIAD